MPTAAALTYPELEQFDVLPAGAGTIAHANHVRFTSLSDIDQARKLLTAAEQTVAEAAAALSRPADTNMLRWRRDRLATARCSLILARMRLTAAEQGTAYDYDAVLAKAVAATGAAVLRGACEERVEAGGCRADRLMEAMAEAAE